MMQCPSCTVTLQLAERQGVEIDYCPQCRGVWLDRGELDKIIERVNTLDMPSPSAGERREREAGYAEPYEDSERYRPRRRKSFFTELFDFD